MRIGRIGSFGAMPAAQSVSRTQSAPEAAKPTQERVPKLPGWQGRDTYESSEKNEDGRVTPTGTYDYLMKAAANAARFDSENFDL